MKKTIAFLLISVCFGNCGEKKATTTDLITLTEAEFDSKQFEMPGVDTLDSLKRVHDSCMGFSFDANTFLLGKVDLFVGSIVNKQSLRMVSNISDVGLPVNELISQLNIISKPCYDQRTLQVPLKTMLGKNFSLNIPGIDQVLNKELNDAIAASGEVDMQAGSWMYLDIQDALKKILDTAKSVKSLHYKNNLLDTSNMVLTALQSISNVSFILTMEKAISDSLQGLLKSKPSVPLSSSPISQISVQLFYINSNKFQMTFTGFFPVAGKFMKAGVK